MRSCIFSAALVFALAAVVSLSASDGASASTTSRLCQHVKERKRMIVDSSKPDIIWSDGAMFEMARTFPRELQELIAAPTAKTDLQPVLSRMSGKTEDGWQDAKPVRSLLGGREHASVESADGKLNLRMASPYFDYLHERY